MKKIFYIFISILLSLNAYSQSMDWVNTSGSSGPDWIDFACTDSSNYIYTLGFFSDTLRFNNSSDVFISRGSTDIFLLKNDQNGNYISCLQIGGYHNEFSRGLEYDESGHLYLIGELSDSVYLNNGVSSQLLFVDTSYNWATSSFLLKLDLNGNLKWSQFFENDYRLDIMDVALDDSSNVIVTGSFEDSLDFGALNQTFNLSSANFSGFLAKFNPIGTLLNTASFDGSYGVYSKQIELYGNDIILTGAFRGTMDADPSSIVFNLQELSGRDIFIISLKNDFTFNWAKKIASTTTIANHSLVGKDGFYYLGGGFLDTTYFDSNNLSSYWTPNGQFDCFILRFNSSGDIDWVKQFGDSLYDYIYGIDINSYNKIFVSGIYAGSVDFDPDTGSYVMDSYQNTRDFFFAEFDTSGNFNWAKSIGNSGLDHSLNIFSSNNDVYVMGSFENTVDFDFDTNQVLRTSYGDMDAYLIKVNLSNTTSLYEKTNNGLNSQLLLFPNPSTNFLKIQGDISKIESFEIYNLNGKLVSERFYESQIDISSLSEGIYFLNTRYKDGSIHAIKFIKTR